MLYLHIKKFKTTEIMKNLMKLVVVVFMLMTTVATSNAQTLKFGHIDLQSLIQVMPERATAEEQFNKFQKELEDVYADIQKEYKTKLTEFEALGEDASQVKKDAKVAELQDIQQRMQNYQVTAQQQVQKKYSELLQPVFEKAENAIAEVAKEKGLIYVFDAGTSNKTLLYKSNQSVDVLPLVKAKLGIN